MQSKRQTVFSENTLDMETGELKTKKWITKTAVKKDEFVVLYMKHISIFSKLSSTETKFLISCTKYIEWNTNELIFNPKIMEGICESSELESGTIRNCVSKLTKKGLFHKKKSNWYILNPDIFFKGSELARSKVFELGYKWNVKENGMKSLTNKK